MFTNMTFGIVLILFGLVILIKALFGIDIPLFRILCGCGLIYWGINLITNLTLYPPINHYQENIRFSSSIINLFGRIPIKKEYNTIFGKLNLTIADTIILDRPQYVKIRTIFGTTELTIPQDMPTQINMMSRFGSTQVVNQSTVSFGEKTVYLGPIRQNPLLIIDIETIFGNCNVQQSP